MHLVVTEKDLAAKRIADILSGGAASPTKVSSANAYRFNSTVVLGLKGHVVKLDFPDEVQGLESRPSRLNTGRHCHRSNPQDDRGRPQTGRQGRR